MFSTIGIGINAFIKLNEQNKQITIVAASSSDTIVAVVLLILGAILLSPAFSHPQPRLGLGLLIIGGLEAIASIGIYMGWIIKAMKPTPPPKNLP